MEFSKQQLQVLKIGISIVVVSFLGLVMLNLIGNLLYPSAHDAQLELVPLVSSVTFAMDQKVNLDSLVLTVKSANIYNDAGNPGYKFVVFHISLTNLTQETVQFSTDGMFQLHDENNQQYLSYSGDTVPSASVSSLNGALLQPSAPEEGDIVYEVKTESASYILSTYKQTTKQTYQIKLTKPATPDASTTTGK